MPTNGETAAAADVTASGGAGAREVPGHVGRDALGMRSRAITGAADRAAAARKAGGKFDPSVPNAARIYDYVLGGKDNFSADREFVELGLRWVPDFPRVMRANREFLGRAVSHLAVDRGIDQFLDIGTGLPTAENVHQVVHRVNPAGRVAYIDNDPVVLTHARALLAENGNVAVAEGDIRYPDSILTAPPVRQLLDFSRPVAVLMVAVLHYATDEYRPDEIVRRFRDAMAPGSYLAISHAEYHPRLAWPASIYSRFVDKQVVLRTRAEIARFFDGFELIEPGVVPVSRWQPGAAAAPGAVTGNVVSLRNRPRATDCTEQPDADEVWFAAGVGRKPSSGASGAAHSGR